MNRQLPIDLSTFSGLYMQYILQIVDVQAEATFEIFARFVNHTCI